MRTIDDLMQRRGSRSGPSCFVRQESLTAYLGETRYASASSLRRASRGADLPIEPRIAEDPSQRLARALHALVLGPARFARDYLVLGRDAPAPSATEQPDALDRAWLSGAEYTALVAARDAIRAYPRAPLARLVDEGINQLSIYWSDENNHRWKARPDCFTSDIVLGLKTTADVRPRGFAQARRRFAYDLKAAHYIEAVRRLTGVTPRFGFVAVELAAPHYVWWHELAPHEVASAQKELAAARERLATARRAA